MTPEELAEIEARLKAAQGDDGTLALTADEYGHVWYADGDACVYVRGNLGLGINGSELARLLAHAPSDIARLLAEVRRLTPAPRIAAWEAGVDDYEGCTVLRDPATGAVLGWCNQFGLGECIWELHLFPGAKRKIADLAVKNGWEVRDA